MIQIGSSEEQPLFQLKDMIFKKFLYIYIYMSYIFNLNHVDIFKGITPCFL